MTKYTVFYSWQSDLPNATNRGFIEKALENVTKIIRTDDSLKVDDFGFDPNNPWHDAECKGLDFLGDNSVLQDSWRKYWPQGSGIHNWDAVARASLDGGTEWILVEAKANLEELKSACKAENKESLIKINAAFDATKKALGVQM